MIAVQGNQVVRSEEPRKLLRICLWSFAFFQGASCMPWGWKKLRIEIAEDDHGVPGGSRADCSGKRVPYMLSPAPALRLTPSCRVWRPYILVHSEQIKRTVTLIDATLKNATRDILSEPDAAGLCESTCDEECHT